MLQIAHFCAIINITEMRRDMKIGFYDSGLGGAKTLQYALDMKKFIFWRM